MCLVGKRGSDPPGTAVGGVGSDIIFSERRGQSQKPEEVYELIEELVPNGGCSCRPYGPSLSFGSSGEGMACKEGIGHLVRQDMGGHGRTRVLLSAALVCQHIVSCDRAVPVAGGPAGRYLEIFARKNNLRNYWVSVGNEVTGTGLPEEDMDALRQSGQLPNAVFGRGITRPL